MEFLIKKRDIQPKIFLVLYFPSSENRNIISNNTMVEYHSINTVS